ncbi:hypothetical protein GW17_00057225 [Ensete ventricosum]|nr:hypothetical protein GW17_00057225 [Ensete ventricosum]
MGSTYRSVRLSVCGTTRYRAIPPKIDRRRSIEGEKGKKKKRKRRKKNLLSTRRPRLCAVAALARGCSFSRARRRNVSP